jgi:hypothetical protein
MDTMTQIVVQLMTQDGIDDSRGYLTENGVVMPAVLPTAGCRNPTKKTGLGSLRPTVGNTESMTTPVSLRCNITEICSGSEEGTYLRLIDVCSTQL